MKTVQSLTPMLRQIWPQRSLSIGHMGLNKIVGSKGFQFSKSRFLTQSISGVSRDFSCLNEFHTVGQEFSLRSMAGVTEWGIPKNIENLQKIVPNSVSVGLEAPGVAGQVEKIEADSVMRKRKKKMKRHKLRKRRRAQRAMKRRLNQG